MVAAAEAAAATAPAVTATATGKYGLINKEYEKRIGEKGEKLFNVYTRAVAVVVDFIGYAIATTIRIKDT